MRKALLLVVASAMVAGGLALLFSELFWSHSDLFSVGVRRRGARRRRRLPYVGRLHCPCARHDSRNSRGTNVPEKHRRPHGHERVQAVERMKRDWQAQRQALATVRRFNAANGKAGSRRRLPQRSCRASLAGHRLRQLRDRRRSRLAR